MTVPMFITLLTAFSAISSLCTEAFKKMFDSAGIKYASNILVFIIACVVGIGGTAIYYVFSSIDFDTINVICMILMGLASSIGATVGYDKVIQTIAQLNKNA